MAAGRTLMYLWWLYVILAGEHEKQMKAIVQGHLANLYEDPATSNSLLKQITLLRCNA